MLKKLIFFAITSGLAAKAYRAFTSKDSGGNYASRKRSNMSGSTDTVKPRAV